MAETFSDSKASDVTTMDNLERKVKHSETAINKVPPEESKSFKEDFERKMRVLGQLKIAKRLRAVFEQAALDAEKATPEEAKKILLDQSKNINELVSLTEALRGSYTLDSYRYYDSIAILNEKRQEKALQKSHDEINGHLSELKKERESPTINGSQSKENEDSYGIKNDEEFNKAGLDTQFGNQNETKKEVSPPSSTKRRRRKPKKNLMEFDDDDFDENQYLMDYSEEQSAYSQNSSTKRKKKAKAELNDDYTDDFTVDSKKSRASRGGSKNDKPKRKYNRKDSNQGSTPLKKKHRMSAVLSSPDHIDGSNSVSLKVKVAVSTKSSADPNTVTSESFGNGELTDGNGELITVKISIAGEETISLTAVMKKDTKANADQVSSSGIAEASSEVNDKEYSLEPSTANNDIDSKESIMAEEVQSSNVDNLNESTTENENQFNGEKSTKSSIVSSAAKKKPRINLNPRKCVNCNKSKTAYFRCHFWFMNGTKCGKIFCKECLTTKFDVEDYDSITSDAEWHCPSCLGRWARNSRSRRRK